MFLYNLLFSKNRIFFLEIYMKDIYKIYNNESAKIENN